MAEPIGESAVRSDAEAASDPSPAAVATTAARALALGSALATRDALRGLGHDLEAIGFRRLPAGWGGWEERQRILADSDDVLDRYHLLDEVRGREDALWIVTEDEMGAPQLSARVDLWRSVAINESQEHAVAWLRLLMADREPTAASAAAAALWKWQRPRESSITVPTPLHYARDALHRYAGSRITDARTIAVAALGPDDHREYFTLPRTGPSPTTSTTSLLVAGTGAWANSWYLKGGDFHSYILKEVRSDLFSGYHAFQWSGSYKASHRRKAARNLAGWVEDVVGHGLNTLFAHSYGGVIALNATTHGLQVQELVLLSVPAEQVRVEWRNIVRRTVSLRIHMDLVLLAARRPQHFTENVEENYLPHWFWKHSDSHDPEIWEREKCAKLLGLDPTY
jgi:hypothetical protein